MTQPKVSIVIPCYNKAECIGNTFDSILNQDLDNIELILINDGSTDSTRDIMAEYETKFKARGYEATIIDQMNQGLSATVCTGLKSATGDYVCQIDADDLIDPKYVSIMAGWLTENLDYDWVACDMMHIDEHSTAYYQTFPLGENEDCKIEKWLFKKILLSICVYMIRANYLKSCGVVDSFYIGREGSQETQIFFPLVLGKGKIKYFRMPLYKRLFFDSENHLSYHRNYNCAIEHYSAWHITPAKVISRLSINEKNKQRLLGILEIEKSICNVLTAF